MLKLGEKSIKSLYLGGKSYAKAYLGSKLVFNKIKKPYYCEIEYLESTGTQWIDTEISPTSKTKWEITLAFTKETTGQLMGAGHAGNYRFNLGIESDKFRFAIGSGWTTLVETKDTDIHTWVLNSEDNSCSLDDTTVLSTYSSDFSTTNYHIIFCNRAVGSNYCSIKIYGSKIYTNNILVRDFIPVLDFDMKPCLYDKVSGKFFYNQGSDEFLYSREIHEVEYIESDGNQYIDTEYNINTETDEVELNYQLLDETVYKWLFGEHDNNARFALGSGDGTNKRNLAYGANTIKLADTYFFDNKHSFKANKEGVFVDGIKFTDYKSFISTSSIWLFGLNLSPYTYGSKTRIWGYRHKRNGSLIRDYIPAVDENGKGFMFDRVTHTIFDNTGSGEFLYGDKI